MRHAPPQLLQPGITAATGSVELVPHRILDVEILVIVLGGPELAGRHDRCDKIVLARFRRCDRSFRALGAPCLPVAVIEDRGAVLPSRVAKLPAAPAGIHRRPAPSAALVAA